MVILEPAIHVISDCFLLFELGYLSFILALSPMVVPLPFTLAKWRFVWQVTISLYSLYFFHSARKSLDSCSITVDLPGLHEGVLEKAWNNESSCFITARQGLGYSFSCERE